MSPRLSAKQVENRRILVVDDDPHVRRMTVCMLRAEGFEVCDVESALILFERAEPRHLLVEQVLGGEEGGLHFAARLSRLRLGWRVVMIRGGHLRTTSSRRSKPKAALPGQALQPPRSRPCRLTGHSTAE